MILSNTEIKKQMQEGKLIICPILEPERQIQGAKVDLRLDNVFQGMKSEQTISHDTFPPKEKLPINLWYEITIPYSHYFVLHPGEFVLGQTFEFVDLSENVFGRLEGRSSLGRQGILVHATASIVDPGFCGVLCLELSNAGRIPVILHPLMRIASIAFEEVKGKVTVPYDKQKDSKFGGCSTKQVWSPDQEFYYILKDRKI